MTHPLTGHPDACICARCINASPTYLRLAMENRDLRERLESAEAALHLFLDPMPCRASRRHPSPLACETARAHFARYAEKKEKTT